MKNVHFAIPEIYGDSLSYYELLSKLVKEMNTVIENYNTIPDQIDEEVKNLDASQLFSAVLNQLIHSIATDNTKSSNAVKVYKKHDLLYATFNETVNLYESIIDFTAGTETELIVGTNIREVNISELFIELRKLIDINKNNIEAVTSVANENSTEITTIHNDITAIENKNTEQDNELSTLRTMISSPYNFKGDVASISALPASGAVNDTYYVQDVKYKVTWTGSAWVQSSLSEADYQTELSELKSDLDKYLDIMPTGSETVGLYSRINNMLITESGKFRVFGNDSYYVKSYQVKAGVQYSISGNARLNLDGYGLVGFKNEYTETDGAQLEMIQYGTTTSTDYEITYTPAENGYIYIANILNTIELVNLTVMSAISDSKRILDLEYKTNTLEQAIEPFISKKDIKIQIFGDSISDNSVGDNKTWVNYISKLMPNYNITVVNSSVAGSTIAYNNESSICAKVMNTEVLEDNDVVVIFGGTNDWAGGVGYGDFLGDGTNNFGNALNEIIKYMSVNKPNTRLIMVTPMQRYNSDDKNRPTNDHGEPFANQYNLKTLNDYCHMIEDTCKFYGIPCLNMYEVGGLNRINIDTWTVDGLHPNDNGDMKIAREICNFIIQHI